MTRKETLLIFANSQHKLINRWIIPRYISEYFEEPSVIAFGDQRIEVPHVSACQACFQSFEDASMGTQVLSPIRELNRVLGYPAKICIDCAWLIEQKKGNVNIPKSIKKRLDAGHVMRLQRYGIDYDIIN